MTPAQQSALEALAGRTLTADELTEIDDLLPARNDVAIAAVLSAGRKVLVARTIDERGVRAALSIRQASQFLSLLKSAATVTTMPTWLTAMLVAMDIDAADHPAYFETLACAYPWLQQEAGIDLASPTTRSMLDMIASSDAVTYGGAVSILKALPERDDPIHYTAVSDALNIAENRDTP